MNIVFVSTRSPLRYAGGAEILTRIIAESLSSLGHNVTIYTAGIHKKEVVAGVTIQRTPFFLFPLRFRTVLLPLYAMLFAPFFKINRDFRRADIVHAVDSDAITLLSFWHFLRHKYVVTIQDYNLLWPTKDFFSDVTLRGPFWQVWRRVKDRIRSKNSALVLQRLKYAVCVSTFVAKEVQKANPKIDIRVIGNGVLSSWRNKNRIRERDIDILYVGKLMPYKGLDVLLQAMYRMPRHVRLIVVGEGLLQRYITICKSLHISDRVSFVGTVPYEDMPSYYRRAKLVVSPSLWPEPCGRSIIEAMWMGCAVVATRVGGTPESLVNGLHGRVVRSGESRALARACVALLTDKSSWKQMTIRAQQYARSRYAAVIIAKQYLDYYDLINTRKLL